MIQRYLGHDDDMIYLFYLKVEAKGHIASAWGWA